MVTKSEARAAWHTFLMFGMSNSHKTTFTKDDLTKRMTDAVVILNDYFKEADEDENE